MVGQLYEQVLGMFEESTSPREKLTHIREGIHYQSSAQIDSTPSLFYHPATAKSNLTSPRIHGAGFTPTTNRTPTPHGLRDPFKSHRNRLGQDCCRSELEVECADLAKRGARQLPPPRASYRDSGSNSAHSTPDPSGDFARNGPNLRHRARRR